MADCPACLNGCGGARSDCPMGENGEPKPLPPRQQRFVEEYLIDLNATRAAIRAGYAPAAAQEQGSRLLSNAMVAAAIARAKAARAQRVAITADRVLQEIARLAFSDQRRLFNEDGNLKRPHELDDDTAAAVASIEIVTTERGEGAVEHVAKIKTWDKTKALDQLARHLGLFNDKLELSGKVDLAAVVEQVRRRARGG